VKHTAAFVLLTFLTVALFLSCERIASPADSVTEMTSKLDSIPAAYGDLEAVTAVPEYPGWYQLWFEDSTGTIHMVRIQINQKLIHKNIEVIPRSLPATTEGM
jgi:hypothetical protein